VPTDLAGASTRPDISSREPPRGHTHTRILHTHPHVYTLHGMAAATAAAKFALCRLCPPGQRVAFALKRTIGRGARAVSERRVLQRRDV